MYMIARFMSFYKLGVTIPKAKQKGKMHSKWEGPFIVASMARPEACRLRTLGGTEDPYSWNKDMLQKYYV